MSLYFLGHCFINNFTWSAEEKMKLTEKIAEEVFDNIYEKLHQKFYDILTIDANEKLINDLFDIIVDNLCEVSLRKKDDITSYIKEAVSKNIDKTFDSVICCYVESQMANWVKEGKARQVFVDGQNNLPTEADEEDGEECDCPDCRQKRDGMDVTDLLNPGKKNKKRKLN
jgi:hypothetical protein